MKTSRGFSFALILAEDDAHRRLAEAAGGLTQVEVVRSLARRGGQQHGQWQSREASCEVKVQAATSHANAATGHRGSRACRPTVRVLCGCMRKRAKMLCQAKLDLPTQVLQYSQADYPFTAGQRPDRRRSDSSELGDAESRS